MEHNSSTIAPAHLKCINDAQAHHKKTATALASAKSAEQLTKRVLTVAKTAASAAKVKLIFSEAQAARAVAAETEATAALTAATAEEAAAATALAAASSALAAATAEEAAAIATEAADWWIPGLDVASGVAIAAATAEVGVCTTAEAAAVGVHTEAAATLVSTVAAEATATSASVAAAATVVTDKRNKQIADAAKETANAAHELKSLQLKLAGADNDKAVNALKAAIAAAPKNHGPKQTILSESVLPIPHLSTSNSAN